MDENGPNRIQLGTTTFVRPLTDSDGTLIYTTGSEYRLLDNYI